MASFKCFVPLVLCVLLAALCTTSAKPVTEESDKKSMDATQVAAIYKKKLTDQLKALEHDVDEFLKNIDDLDAELDTITAMPDEEVATPKVTEVENFTEHH